MTLWRYLALAVLTLVASWLVFALILVAMAALDWAAEWGGL